MNLATSRPEISLVPLLIKGYLLGTIVASLALHVAIAFIAPGDAGAVSALIFPFWILFLFIIGLFGLLVFPIGALISWPHRRLSLTHPISALTLSVGAGAAFGAATSALFDLRVGPNDFWSAPIVGGAFGLVWFVLVRAALLRHLNA